MRKTEIGFDMTPTSTRVRIYREERERKVSGLKPNKRERTVSGL